MAPMALEVLGGGSSDGCAPSPRETHRGMYTEVPNPSARAPLFCVVTSERYLHPPCVFCIVNRFDLSRRARTYACSQHSLAMVGAVIPAPLLVADAFNANL